MKFPSLTNWFDNLRVRSAINANAPEGLDNCPSELTFQGDVEVQAAEGEASGETPPRMLLIAYTGKPMDLNGFPYPVVVDLNGAKFDGKTTAIIADHNRSNRIGHTTEQLILAVGNQGTIAGRPLTGPVIAAAGLASSTTVIAKEFIADAKAGIPFQVSIGATLIAGEVVDEGDSVIVNGKTWKGPLIVARKSIIRELSVLIIGADNKTSVKLAASHRGTDPETAMTFEEFIESLGFNAKTITAEQKTKFEATWKKSHPQGKTGDGKTDPPANPKPDINADDAERNRIRAAAEQRIDRIIDAAGTFKGRVEKVKVGDEEMDLLGLKAHAILHNWTPEQFELTCLKAELPKLGSGPAIHVREKNYNNAALEASLLRTFGIPGREKNAVTGREFGLELWYKPEVLEASEDPIYRCGGSIQALLDMQIRAAGMHPGHDRKSSDFISQAVDARNMIRAAGPSGFSTIDVANVLENVMHKTALASFEAVEVVWPFICGRRSLNDFRPHNLYRLDFNGHFKQVAVDGELKHISLTDEKHSIQADTFGCMLTIDRKTITNDDLGVIVQKSAGIGSLGAARIEESVFVLLLSNPGSFFASGNGNLLEAGSALAVATLSNARQKFRDQVVNGKPVGISPRVLLVGTTLETTANRLWSEEKLQATGNTDDLVFINNPHKGLYRPYVSGYLNNTGITDQDGEALSGQSDTQWYLFGAPNTPQGSAIAIGFLNGRETPFFDSAETQFNVPGGMQFRSYLDWGVAMHVQQLAVKATGAAP